MSASGELTRWATAVVGAVALACGLTIASAGAAQAIGLGDNPAPTTPPTSRVTGPTTGQVGNCSVVSSPAFLGLSCGSATGAVMSAEQILDGDKVPDCWHEPLTEAELAAVGYQNTPGPDGSRWYWERCMKGIDPTSGVSGVEIDGATESVVPPAAALSPLVKATLRTVPT